MKYAIVFIFKQYSRVAKEITDCNFLQITIAIEEISQGMSSQGQYIRVRIVQCDVRVKIFLWMTYMCANNRVD